MCDALTDGQTMTSICEADDMPSPQAFRKYCLRHKEAAEQVEQARIAGAWAILDEATDILRAAIGNKSNKNAQAAREFGHHARWLVKSFLPGLFGDKTQVNGTMTIGWANEDADATNTEQPNEQPERSLVH